MRADRFRDHLVTNGPYAGMVADSYDAFLPPGAEFAGDDVHADVIRRCGDVALELGVGNGRFLLPRLAEGLDVEGVDNAEDILDRCRRHVEAGGFDAVLHHGDMAPLDLGRTYGAICCTAGSFTLVTDADRVRAALASYAAHLRPGGTLAISMFVPGADDDTAWCWRLRRTGTGTNGVTYLVHEATSADRDAQVLHSFTRLEALDPSGHVVETTVRKYRLRWWTRSQLEELLAAAGFVDVASVGSDDQWVTVGQRTG